MTMGSRSTLDAREQIRTKSRTFLADSPPKCAGRDALHAPHVHGKMALMGEACFQRNAANWESAFPQQQCRPLYAAANHVLVHRQANRLAEEHLAVRDAESCDTGNLQQSEIVAQVVFNEGKHLLQFAAGDAAVLFAVFCRVRTMAVHQARRQSGGETFTIEPAAGISVLFFRFERPSNVFNLRIAYLKSVSHFQLLRIHACIFCDSLHEGRSHTQDERYVRLFQFPHAGCTGRDDVDVTVDCGTAMASAAASACHMGRRPYMNADSSVRESRNFDHTRSVG